MTSLQKICSDLQDLQRQRRCNLKSRIMIVNRMVATVAVAMGYHGGMTEKERKKRIKAAESLIEKTVAGKVDETSPCYHLILDTNHSIEAFDRRVDAFETEMVKLAKQLPVARWVKAPEQNGFGFKSLAVVVGEAGDLRNYPNPAKLWKRMGCAPYQRKGTTQMPSTWRSLKALSSEEWSELGYCPRRRSDVWNIETCLIKLNGNGPYRKRYNEAKKRFKKLHRDYSALRCHNHARLMMGKRLLLNLWIQWTGGDHRLATDNNNAARPAKQTKQRTGGIAARSKIKKSGCKRMRL